MVCLIALIHAVGVVTITRMLGLEAHKPRAHGVDLSAIMLSAIMALSLFLLHFIEIALFAIFYMGVGAILRFEEALFFSASAYATLGQPDVAFPEHWRLVGAIEGLIGFLMIGWSTGVFINDMTKLLRGSSQG